MKEGMELVLQFGALGLLGGLIFWGTRSGWPQMFEALAGIRVAIERNTSQLKSFDEHQILQTKVLLRLVEKSPAEADLKEEATRLRTELERQEADRA